MTPTTYHDPVLLDACLDGPDLQPGGVYVDVTFGGGGHSRALLDRMTPADGPAIRLFGFDQDADAKANAINDPRLTFVAANFRNLKRYLRLLWHQRSKRHSGRPRHFVAPDRHPRTRILDPFRCGI